MRLTLVLASMFLFTLAFPVLADGPSVSYGQAIKHDTSPPLMEMVADAPPAAPGGNRQVPIGVRPDFVPDPANAAPDAGRQSLSVPALGPTPAPIVSADGLS